MADRAAPSRRPVMLVALLVMCLAAGVAGWLYQRQSPAFHRATATPAPSATAPMIELAPPEDDVIAPQTPSATIGPGTGQFTVAPGVGTRGGSAGRFIRYEVRVETGSGVDPAVFALAVEETLGDARGWTAAGRWSFQRFGEGPTDLTIHLAAPDTTAVMCARFGVRTNGEVSCRGGRNVVINLKRWLLGVPWFEDALREYQHMVVNHEVGHFLGFGHAVCPAAGTLAPVMQRQTLGLGGCVRNPWPYPDGRTFRTGPDAPY